VYFLIV